MKRSLKLLALPATMVLLASNITSCSPAHKRIAMISDVGDIDDGSFNQGCWESIKKYGQDNKISYDYYRPFADSDFARDCAIKQAVTKGAEIIILPGFKFATAASKAAKNPDYKNVHFVLIDSTADVVGTDNLVCVNYDFQNSGWLAGYTVARDYFLTDWNKNGKLNKKYGFGFFGGMSNPGVYPYGFGYLQGLLYAAQEFCLEKNIVDPNQKPDIYLNYSYAGVFSQDDMACSTVKGWLTNENQGPIECVFACGGKLYQSVTEAVKFYNQHSLSSSLSKFEDQKAPREAARWIGVDADQYSLVQDYDEKKAIYTSALKDVGHTCKVICDYHFQNKWNVLRNSMDEKNGFVLGLQDSFVKDYLHIESDDKYDYVGITPDVKPGQESIEEDKRILRSFNYVTLGELKTKITELHERKIKIYNGFSLSGPGDYGEFGEEAGYPKILYDFNNPASHTFFDSEYNKINKEGVVGQDLKYHMKKIHVN